MELQSATTDYFLASSADASTARSVERLQGSDEGIAWWWCHGQADSYPAQWAVLETNQVLDHLDAVQYVVSQMMGVNVVVPQAVVKELELLRGMERPESGRPAGAALQYIRSELQAMGGYRCKGSSDRSSLLMQDDGEALYDGLHGSFDCAQHCVEDDVLACVRYFATAVAPHMTELLTSDRRLVIKAASHGVLSESVMMFMGRGIFSSAECQVGDVECPLMLGEPDGPPGLASLVLLATEDHNWSRLDANVKAEELVQQEGDYSLAVDSQGSVHVSQDEGSSRGSFCSLDSLSVGKGAGHGFAASTRSPSSEDGSSEPFEISTDGRMLDFPPGLPQVQDEEPELDDMEQTHEGKVQEGIVTEGRLPSTDNSCSKRHSEMIVLRGLPFNVTEEEVLAFIHKAGVPREFLAPWGAVALLANAYGRPSGFAEVRLAHCANLRDVRVQLHMQHLRGRYIEVLPPKPTRKTTAKRQAWRVKQ